MVADTQKKVTLTIKGPPYSTRATTRASLNSAASGSLYGEDADGTDNSGIEDDGRNSIIKDEDDEDGDEEFGVRKTRSRSRQKEKAKATEKRKKVVSEYQDYDVPIHEEINSEYVLHSGRRTVQKNTYVESSDNDNLKGSPPPRSQPRRAANRSAVLDSDEEDQGLRKSARLRSTRQAREESLSSHNSRATESKSEIQKNERAQRLHRRQTQTVQRDPSFELEEDADADGEINPDMILDDDAVATTPEPQQEPSSVARRISNAARGQDNRGYRLRTRAKNVNYVIPPPLDADETYNRFLSMPSRSRSKPKNRMNWNMNGTELSRAMGLPVDDTDSDAPGRSPKKKVGAANGPAAAGGLYASGPIPQDLSGGPANLGKITSSNALADTDPLGVNPSINFDSVGGLDAHIASLKEMTLLPLLYPEVFQRFGVTPPRGVLFHGPPGTGKTLMARALASSCRSDGKNISFFMRKGADCLSKWVGEAERQLRLLFEEAKNSQPSIIFFDEIDGLAPVRSSKQDQIHASIVSTLLALMDGMDGRGQVIVIGATNRPDAIDSALRRPGRFDREFYFPLPSLPDRQSILRIHTSKWEGWEKDSERGEKMRAKLAAMTKGYGGADLRMLCTEAALNAVQRTYPQIYKSTDRLLVQPEKIMVQPRDFMGAIKKLVPSSARSTSSTAAPLPTQLVPLLTPALEHVKSLVIKIVPANVGKKRDLLEEAEWEWDDDGDENRALERELLMQSMETLRVYRPRLVLCGGHRSGSGVGYVASALLDWLEGFHIQSLDLATLMSDSTRTVEAAIVQLFVEAKRRQPSVVYIPSLTGWCATVSETSRSTVKAMLDTLAPTDPVLLLAIVDGSFSSLPRDVRQWFGLSRDANNVDFGDFSPSSTQRAAFFEDLLNNVRKRPSDFPDGWKKRKRVLEALPLAPPSKPKPLSETQLAAQQENDMRTLTVLKYRLGPTLNDLKRKFKVFTKRACDDYGFNPETGGIDFPDPQAAPTHLNEHVIEIDEGVQVVPDDAPVEYIQPVQQEQHQQQSQMQVDVPEVPEVQTMPKIKFYNMDLEVMHTYLYQDKYLCLEDFMGDIAKIAHNAKIASVIGRTDQDRPFKAQALLTAAQVHYLDFDPNFRVECTKMAKRQRKRREEERKEEERRREEEKQKEGSYAPGTRRSNRANGLAPEHGITDIGKVERSLKRLRSSESGSAREDGPDNDKFSNKRSRISEDQDEQLQATNPEPEVSEQTAQVPSSTQPEILAPATPSPPSPPTQSIELNSTQITKVDISHVSVGAAPVSSMSLSSLLNADSSSYGQHQPVHVERNVILNGIFPNNPGNSLYVPPMQLIESLQIPSGQQLLNPPEVPPMVQSLPVTGVPNQLAAATPTSDLPITEGQPISVDQAEPPAPTPQRSPTPPPDFIIDETLMSRLHSALVHDTSSLEVEELEQLRASALDTIWRARSSWDRKPLITELLSLIQEFVRDVRASMAENQQEEQM